jgi:hypothetical protein
MPCTRCGETNDGNRPFYEGPSDAVLCQGCLGEWEMEKERLANCWLRELKAPPKLLEKEEG